MSYHSSTNLKDLQCSILTVCFHHETCFAFVSIFLSAPTALDGSSDLQNYLTLAACSIPTSDGAGIFGLDQDPSLSCISLP